MVIEVIFAVVGFDKTIVPLVLLEPIINVLAGTPAPVTNNPAYTPAVLVVLL